jgi:hypothetical protein
VCPLTLGYTVTQGHSQPWNPLVMLDLGTQFKDSWAVLTWCDPVLCLQPTLREERTQTQLLSVAPEQVQVIQEGTRQRDTGAKPVTKEKALGFSYRAPIPSPKVWLHRKLAMSPPPPCSDVQKLP